MGNAHSSARERYTDIGDAPTPDPSNVTTEAASTSLTSLPALTSPSPYQTGSQHGQPGPRSHMNVYGSIRRRMSTRPLSMPAMLAPQRSSEREEEQDQRPLVYGPLDATIESSGVPAVGRFNLRGVTTNSRHGSRFLPDSVARVLLSSGEETPAEGRALRNGALERQRSSLAIPSSPESNSRFSLAGSLRRRFEHQPDTRSDPHRRTIRGPFPLNAPHHLLNHDLESSIVLQPDRYQLRPSPEDTTPLRRNTRLRRVRNSLSSPFSSLLSSSEHRLVQRSNNPASTRSRRATTADDSDHLLPSLANIDHRVDLEDTPHELDAVEPETRNILSTPNMTSGMSTVRRFPDSLRSRSTRLLRRTENPPLSQVLELAAAAIAAQLSGHTTALGGARPSGGDTFDGSIQSFVRTLQEAASAQAGGNIDVNASDGDLPPVNFMRVFQFPNDEHGSPITSQAQSRNVAAGDMDQITGSAEHDRSVTLVLVGVRSMPHGQERGSGDAGPLSTSLDNLLSVPFLTPTNLLGHGGSGALFRRSEGRQRFNPRRHSMTNFRFPAQYESQRHQPTRSPTSGNLVDPSFGNSMTSFSESPPGPNPPPSTPADMRSGQVTPVRRPSSASAIHSALLPDLDEDHVQNATSPLPVEPAYNVARRRRRSDSEFARRPELGSGASRRNGMVEPDPVPASIGRSWLIYVVGTNVSSDHPAFTMPSLFTDNPSYEDMQMLSTLLGPVKPPVATDEDVSAAGGLFRIVLKNLALVAESVAGDSTSIVPLTGGERCLICLCDYEVGEDIRKLTKCQHMYHRECVDEVSLKLYRLNRD